MRYPRISDTPDSYDSEGNRLCRNCDNLISENRRHYCSEECMNQFNRENSWFFVRKDILKRDRYTCQICKTRLRKKFLDIDHIIPVRMGGQLLDKANLRTLCKECHKKKTNLDSEVLNGKI